MAYIYDEPSRTFGEYLLVPGYSGKDCIPANVSLRTPLVKYRRGVEEPPISINIPMVSAVMQAVSNDTMAIALAREGGISFIYGSQTPDAQAQMVRNVSPTRQALWSAIPISVRMRRFRMCWIFTKRPDTPPLP